MCSGCSNALRIAKHNPAFVATAISMGLEALQLFHPDNDQPFVLFREDIDKIFLLKNLANFALDDKENALCSLMSPVLGTIAMPLLRGMNYLLDHPELEAVDLSANAEMRAKHESVSAENMLDMLEITPHVSWK
jgi:hypothetical protein